MSKNAPPGKIEFTEHALCTLIEHVTSQTYGVMDMTTASRTGHIAAAITRAPHRGVEVVFNDENHVTIHVNIVLHYGTNIASVADNLINAVRYHIETGTTLKVNQVNVHVQGLRVPDSNQ